MALYAFDGTGKTDVPDFSVDSNVVWFYNAYTGANKVYLTGVGTAPGPAKVLGLITGFGGHDRIRHALSEVSKNFQAGDRDIDIVGFSRGAAEAVDFANEIAKQTKLPGPSPASIRFLGIWDVVGSFDLPGTVIENVGFDFKTPPTAKRIVHCMALDERRVFFPLTRMSGTGANEQGRLLELWFRGVHSDVGGGDTVPGLSSITLNFMFNQAIRAGVPIDPAHVTQNAQRMDPAKPISFDLVHAAAPLEPPRVLIHGDSVHVSVTARDPITVNGVPYQYNNPPTSLTRVDDNGQPVLTQAAG
ncbi:MAG TPA: DUF2235 domain-containing protein [Bryobacteraceae bacterium]|nr:DUF2235 domain-containing protein [Bryobacteraceae bacterium]